MSDSDDERLPDVPTAPRQNRFRFKTFAKRISEVDVDVYKRLGSVKAEPSGGSWLADGLTYWRELNSASHFLQTSAELQPLCQSLPLLVHNQKAIAHILLGSLEPAARLSLPALLDILSRFARDLQQQFLPLLNKVVRRLVYLLNGGAEREPESLEAIFTCMSYICKHLVKHLAADLPTALRLTAPLRYHRADFVRQFAAQAVGYLLRAAPSTAALRSGVRAVLAEQAVRPTAERTDGAGLVLAEAVLGVSHGLHSRAPQVLQLLLLEDLLQPSDLRPAAPKAVDAAGEAASAEASEAPTHEAVLITQEQLRARASAVARVALARLLDHLRRGKGEAMWETLLAEAHARLRSFEIAAAGVGSVTGLSAATGAAARSLGRVVLLVSEAVGYFRGSRVESYKPLLELLGRLMQPIVWLPLTAAAIVAAAASGSDGNGDSSNLSSGISESPIPSPQQKQQQRSGTPEAAVGIVGGFEDKDDDNDLLDISLSYAVLELARCVVYGHLKPSGAREGHDSLARVAASWSPCFSRPPATEALLFVKALMVPPAGAEIARLFAPQMMGCLGRFIMQQQQPEVKVQQQQDYASSALLLLRDLCALLQPSDATASSRPTGLPLLLTAQPHGVRLAAHVRALAMEWRPGPTTDPGVCAKVWAAVSLLPHASESDAQAVSICEQVLEATSAALQECVPALREAKWQRRLSSYCSGNINVSDGAAVDVESGLLLVHATATELLAELLKRQQQFGLSVSLVTAAERAVQWVLDRLDLQESEASGIGADYASLRSAGSLLSTVRASVSGGAVSAAMGSGAILEMARGLLSESRLQKLVGRLAPLLAHEAQTLRAAVLRLLCCFDQPALEALGFDAKDPTAGLKQNKLPAGMSPRCDLLEVLYSINSQPSTIESGRKWAVAMGRLKTYLEYNRIPEFLVPAFAYGMVGVTYIRFSPLWKPASEALAACLEFRPQVAWPIVFAFLTSSQSELLSGNVLGTAGRSGGAGPRSMTTGGGRYRSAAAISAAINAAPMVKEVPVSEDPSVIESLDDRYGAVVHAGTPQAAGGVTDPQNRLSHVLRAMAAAPYNTIEKYAKDWVTLFLDYTAARGSHFDDGEGDVDAAVAVVRAAAMAADAVPPAVAENDVAARPRKMPRTRDGAAAPVPALSVALMTHGSVYDHGDDPAIWNRRESHRSAGCFADGVVLCNKRKLPNSKKSAAAAGIGIAAVANAAEPPTPPASAVGAAGSGSGGVSVLSRIGGKTWRAGLLDWLKLLSGLRGVRGLHRSEELQRAISSHLLEPDSVIQVATLKCLRPYRFRWLPVEMSDRLGRLADDATLREELVVFPLAPGADSGIDEEARPGLIPLLIRVLFLKMRKRSGRLGGRGASGSARAAILNFLAGLRPDELRPLLELLLEPMAAAFRPPPEAVAAAFGSRTGGAAIAAKVAELDRYRLLPPPWWSAPLLSHGVGWWLAAVDPAALDALPARRKVGFLNAFEDLLLHLGHRLEPFLPTMLAITLRLLTAATSAISPAATATGANGDADASLNLNLTLTDEQPNEKRDADGAYSEEDPEDGDSSDEDSDVRQGANGSGKAKREKPARHIRRNEDGSGAARTLNECDGDEYRQEAEVTDPDSDAEDGNRGDAAGKAATASEPPPLERHREVRSTALRLLAQVWLRFPASTSADYNELWDVFLSAVQPLIPRLHLEAASSKEPPLLECVLSLSLSPGLARVLGDMPSVPDATLSLVRPAAVATCSGGGSGAAELMEQDGTDPRDGQSSQDGGFGAGPRNEWQVQGLGSSLVRGVVAMLNCARCTEIVRTTVLDVLEAVLGCGEQLLRRILLPWLPDVLKALHVAIAESWQQKSAGGRGNRGRFRRRGASGSTSHRELLILERLGGFVTDSELAMSLADSLVALLTQAAARSLKRRASSAGKAARLDEAGISRALGALAALWSKLKPGDLPEKAVERYCEVMSMWAIRLTGRDARAQLVAAYGAVAGLVPRMASSAALLTELTAWSAAVLDEIDYDRRLAAYSSLTEAAWMKMDRLQALPILLTSLYDLRNTGDLALRQAAASALANLVAALAAVDAFPAAAAASMEVDGGGDASVVDPPDSLLRLTGRVLYPQIKSQLCSSSLAVRQEHLMLLRAMVVAMPRRIKDLALLLSDDVETDFFYNVAHLQSHRRTRALIKLTKLLKSQDIGDATRATVAAAAMVMAAQPALGPCLMDVIAPLLQQFIEEGAGGGGDVRAHEKKQSDLDKEANVTDAAITALGALAAKLPWPQYEQLLNQFMRLMRARPAKPFIRAVCNILDNFHFPLPKEDAGGDGGGGGTAAAAAAVATSGQKSRKAAEAELEEDGSDDGRAAAVAVYDAAAEAAAVQRSLLVRVMPALHEQLVERKRGEDEEAASVRAPVALALVKLLKLLPPAAEQAELPRTLQGVANLLRSRPQRVRDDARAVLVSMMAELGPRYLPYACHVLRASLPDRGFTAHVIGYTLHAVLEAVVKVAHGESAAVAAAAAVAEPADAAAAAPSGYDIDDDDGEGGGRDDEMVAGGIGVLDESLELCLPLIEADLFGEVSEAKEVMIFAMQYKEAKRCRANEAYQLLASGITFSTHMRMLLTLVTDRLHLAGQPSIREKLTQLLQFAARGVRANPTAAPKQIMALVVGIMEGCLDREEDARARAKAAVGPAVSSAAALAPAAAAMAAAAAAAAAANGDAIAERAAVHETLVLEFCLTLLHSGVKRGALTGRSPELMALLDPALPLLVRALRSRHAGCVSLALRTLSHIVPLPLPSLTTEAPVAGTALMALLKKVPNIRHTIAQECFRLLAALLRDCDAYQPTTAQLRFLLRWAFEDLGEAGAQPTAFALLRALLGRRVVVPEVYDVMDRVQQIMVRSQAAPVRTACSVALLQFLLDFPLGPQRLKQHVGFLLANLEYEYESGRLQVLDMLAQVVAKFPVEVLQAQADALLMPLVVRLVADTSPKARAASGEALRALLSRLETPQLDKAVSYCRSWLDRDRGGAEGGSGQDAALRRAAAQTLGFVAEVEGGRFGRRLGEVAPGVLRILEWQAARGVDGDDDLRSAYQEDDSAATDTACPGWQEAYYCLILLEKVAAQASAALVWPASGSGSKKPDVLLVPQLWEAAARLLLHRHLWVRKAAARLVGYGLAAPRVCRGFMAARRNRAGQLAFSFFLQLECEAADEATCLQAVKCLVSLSVHLQRESGEEADRSAQNGERSEEHEPQQRKRRARDAVEPEDAEEGSGMWPRHVEGGRDLGVDDDDHEEEDEDEERDEGDEEEDVEGESYQEQLSGKDSGGKLDREDVDEEQEDDAAAVVADDKADDESDDVSMAAQVRHRAFTLHGLVRRMARLADDARWARSRQRLSALRWIAAVATALGATAITPYLPVLLRPLFRISEAAAAAAAGRHSGIEAAGSGGLPEDVRELAEEVMAHLRGLVGSEVLLASYNVAREHVRGLRKERKRRTAMRGMVDPAAAAAARLRHGVRKAEGRKRKLEVLKRERSATHSRQSGRQHGGGGGRRRGR